MGHMVERRSPRISYEVPVRLMRGGTMHELQSADVSREGLFVITDIAPKPREVIKLVVMLPHGQPLKAMAMVTRLVPGPPAGLGLQFFAVAPEAKERWEQFLHEIEPELGEERIFAPTRYPPEKAIYVLRPPDAAALSDFGEHEVKGGELHLAASDEPVDVGDKVNIFVIHPTTEGEFEMCGEVIRQTAASGDRPEGLGVELLDKGEALWDRFAKFVETGKSS